MTDLRTAAQQALEALDGLSEDAVCQSSHHAKKDRHTSLDVCPVFLRLCVAIIALRAALAQQAEPVRAWMDPATGDVISDARHEAWERDFGLAGKGKAALFTVPLYTAPPQRKPLPNHDQHCVDVPGYGLMAVRLVRAVERAHGIGEGA